MIIALLVAGVGLMGFGALVLIRFPDRPGGRVEFNGLKIDSTSAGLPLIALGVVALAFAVTSDRPKDQVTTDDTQVTEGPENSTTTAAESTLPPDGTGGSPQFVPSTSAPPPPPSTSTTFLPTTTSP